RSPRPERKPARTKLEKPEPRTSRSQRRAYCAPEIKNPKPERRSSPAAVCMPETKPVEQQPVEEPRICLPTPDEKTAHRLLCQLTDPAPRHKLAAAAEAAAPCQKEARQVPGRPLVMKPKRTGSNRPRARLRVLRPPRRNPQRQWV